VEFENSRTYFSWARPTYRRPKLEFTARAGTRSCVPPLGDHAHRLESCLAPVAVGCRRPTWVGPYPRTWALPEELLPHFASSSCSLSSASHSQLCLALAPTLLHVTGHLCPPSSPTKSGNRTAVTPSTCSSNHEPESPANDARKSRSPSHRLPLAASPLTTAVRAPPASPPRLGGPHESIV
jgi:hypothetical protein